MSDFRVDDGRLVRYIKEYSADGGVAYTGETTVITKDEFIACYNTWISRPRKKKKKVALLITVDEKYYEACKDSIDSFPSQIEEAVASGKVIYNYDDCKEKEENNGQQNL